MLSHNPHGLKVGDIVRPMEGFHLRSGGQAYGGAIVVSVTPFVLVSEHADMKWSATVKIENFKQAGIASKEQLAKAMTRLDN